MSSNIAGTVSDLATHFTVMIRHSLTVAFPQHMSPDLRLNVIQIVIMHII